MWRTMLEVALNHNDDKNEEPGDRVDADEGQSATLSGVSGSVAERSGIDDAVVPPELLPGWTPTEYASIVREHLCCRQLLPHLLGTASYVFSHDQAQVVPMILHRTADSSPGVTDMMIALQRQIVYYVILMIERSQSSEETLAVKHVPHKVRRIGGHTAKDCWSDRQAQVLYRGGKSEVLGYSYLGGGVPFDPPYGFGLVSRRLPLPVADRLFAVCLYLSGMRHVDAGRITKCFVRRIDVTGVGGVSDEQAESDIKVRVQAVSALLSQLQRDHESFEDFFAFWIA